MSDEKVEMTGTFGSNPKFFAREIIDRKGNAVDPGECIIFKVTDGALPELIDVYSDICGEYDSPEQHVEETRKLLSEVTAWQLANKDRVKAAD